MKKVAVCRIEHFTAAHRLHNPAWSDEKNKQIFRKCNNKNYHGHNYELIVNVMGEVNTETGFVIDFAVLSEIIHTVVIDTFDHKNLNLDVPHFATLNPTAENIAIVIYNLLREKIDTQFELKIKLSETPNSYVEYPISA